MYAISLIFKLLLASNVLIKYGANVHAFSTAGTRILKCSKSSTCCSIVTNTLPTIPVPSAHTIKLSLSSRVQSSKLCMSNSNFDLSKPTFDLFSFRTIRNDALLQYSSLNQSEPLRINLYLILTVILFSFPTTSEAVIGEQSTLQSTIISTLLGLGSFTLFLKECRNRLNQLLRIEKEMNAEYLKLSLSTQNKFNPRLFEENTSWGGDSINSMRSTGDNTLKALRGKKRVIAICGKTNELKDVLLSFRIFRRRMKQSNSIVVPVPTDLDSNHVKEWWKQLGITEMEIRSCQWLAQAQDISSWNEYFNNLIQDHNDRNNELVWFGLNYNGRSFASGSGSKNGPILLQILGQNLRPIEILDESDEPETINAANKEVDVQIMKEVQTAQREFYDALTNGNLEKMKKICSKEESPEVTEVVNAAGRIDGWEMCLDENARPANMKISGSDILIVSPTVAYSTCVEFPMVSSGGYDNASYGATLLAVQRWGKKDDTNEWKLEYHSTIPWSPDTRAGGTLRCDCRGCVALTRGPERRTFGGMIG